MKYFAKGDEGCEEPIDVAYLDGYSVGDRLLEGVMFQCRFNDKGTIDVQIDPSSASYFSTLNQKKWLKEVTAYANDDCDGFLADVEGSEDAFVMGEEPQKSKPAPVRINKSSPVRIQSGDIFAALGRKKDDTV